MAFCNAAFVGQSKKITLPKRGGRRENMHRVSAAGIAAVVAAAAAVVVAAVATAGKQENENDDNPAAAVTAKVEA